MKTHLTKKEHHDIQLESWRVVSLDMLWSIDTWSIQSHYQYTDIHFDSHWKTSIHQKRLIPHSTKQSRCHSTVSTSSGQQFQIIAIECEIKGINFQQLNLISHQHHSGTICVLSHMQCKGLHIRHHWSILNGWWHQRETTKYSQHYGLVFTMQIMLNLFSNHQEAFICSFQVLCRSCGINLQSKAKAVFSNIWLLPWKFTGYLRSSQPQSRVVNDNCKRITASVTGTKNYRW